MSCFNCYGDHREPECQALCRFCLYYPRNVPHNCAAVRMRYPRSVFQKYFARAKQENRLSTFELSQEARVEIEV